MVEYRLARPEERRAYIDFANLVFNDAGTDIDFEQAIPKVYGAGRDCAHMQHIAVDDALGIRGLVAVKPGMLHMGDDTLRTGFVGTVSTHPQARGEGHMKALMAQAIADMRAEGVDLALLGGQRQRYEYYGFVPAGLRWRAEINRSNVRHALSHVDAEGVTFTELQPGSELEARVAAMHARLPVWQERNEPDFATVCRTFHGTAFACEQRGRLIGWAVANRSRSCLTEVGVQSADDLDVLLKGWLAQSERWEITVELPPYRPELVRRLGLWAESMQQTPCLNARILNYPRTVAALLALKARYTRLSDSVLPLDCEGQRFTVRVSGGEVSVERGAEDPLVLDAVAAGRLLLSPFPMDGVPETPAGWFPLPVYSCEPDDF